MTTTYEFNGEQYAKASQHQKEWGGRMISELPLRGDETVIDLGCGDGLLTERIARRVPVGRVVGIGRREKPVVETNLARERVSRGDPVDGPFHLSAIVRRTVQRAGIVGAAQLGNLPSRDL